jgi:DNA invertase Pin-like site-specific DNA recombinase
MTLPLTAIRAGPPEADDASINLRAARYVRMSTDHQQYTTQNQADTIAAYAEQHKLTIVREYADEARSGLHYHSRPALKQLISDVLLGQADFSCILVYDVSRWGRFQDIDESAHYEFICREAGVGVEYCAEQFRNDGSLISNIAKSLKRAMAGEYSRELSPEVFAAQCRLIKLGFKHGGSATYGLNRQLLDEHGVPKGILAPGQRKSLAGGTRFGSPVTRWRVTGRYHCPSRVPLLIGLGVGELLSLRSA